MEHNETLKAFNQLRVEASQVDTKIREVLPVIQGRLQRSTKNDVGTWSSTSTTLNALKRELRNWDAVRKRWKIN